MIIKGWSFNFENEKYTTLLGHQDLSIVSLTCLVEGL